MENPPMSEAEPLSEADRLMTVIRVMLEALLEFMDDPATSTSDVAAARFLAELQVADAMLGRTR